MPISYNVYKNDGRGGIVDYSTPIATTTNLTFACGVLATPGDTTFAVRAFDVQSGIEEANTQARVRIVLDAQGNDVTRRPGVVQGLSARGVGGGSCRVAWGYVPISGAIPPTKFDVFLTRGADPDLSRVAASLPYQPGVVGYELMLPGLMDNILYTVAVRASASDPVLKGDPATVQITVAATRLQDVESLTGTSLA